MHRLITSVAAATLSLVMPLGTLAQDAAPDPPRASAASSGGGSDDVRPASTPETTATPVPSTGGAADDISDEAESAKVARRGLHDSVWPAPLADLWRTSSVVGAGLSSDVDSASMQAEHAELPPDPVFGVVYDDRTVFVLGGSPALLSIFTDGYRGVKPQRPTLAEATTRLGSGSDVDPWVARVDVETMDIAVLSLPRGSTINYIGSIIAHENGNLYVVAMSTLFEIDPTSFRITRSLELPLPEEGRLSIYNALTVWPATGDLILKRADFTQRTPTALVLVDTEEMAVMVADEFDAGSVSDVGVSRLTVAEDGDTTYVYASGSTQTLRFAVSEEGFALDGPWSQVYVTAGDGTQQGGGAAYMGRFASIAFVNNGSVTLGVRAPISVFAQSTASTFAPIARGQVNDVVPGGVFAVNSADPHHTGITAALDNVNGVATGWSVDEGSLEKLWSNNDLALSAGSAIAVDQGHLYTDDRTCDQDGEDCTLYLVVIDIATGAEIARTEVAGTLPTIGHIFIGADEVFYIATEAGEARGYLTRVRG